MDRTAAVTTQQPLPGGEPARRSDSSEDFAPSPQNSERLVADAVALAKERTPELASLVARYWWFVADGEVVGRTAQDLVAVTEAHQAFAAQRVPGELLLRVNNPDDSPHTVIEIVTDDMPFLVDSVTAELNREDNEVLLLVHPQVVVKREPLGKALAVRPDADPDDLGDGDLLESWMHIEVDRVRDETSLADLSRRIQKVLTDVREAVEDWQRMRQKALSIADELADDLDLPTPERDRTDGVDLMRWLAGENFTFLGYREYEIIGGTEKGELRAVMGTGLGILRQDSKASRPISSIPAEARAKLTDKRLLIITKANSRATVHRPVFLDYIGVKVFDKSGNVVGEKRFVGLLGSAAYLQSVSQLPVVKRKTAEVIRRSGLSARSHSGRDLTAILESYPRDELFQARTDEIFATAMGVLKLAGRHQMRLFLRRDGYGRFVSALVYLPRDWHTTRNRLKIEAILREELNAVAVDFTALQTQSPISRIHFIVRTDPNRPLGQLDAGHIQRLVIEAIRQWDDDFRSVLIRKVGDEQGRTLYKRYVDAFSQTYKDEHQPYQAAKDIAKLELLDEPGELAIHLYRRLKNPDDVRFKIFRYGEQMMLSTVLPVLHSLGVTVSDERPYEVNRGDGRVYLYDFGLRIPDNSLDIGSVRAKVENAFSTVWRGESEVDSFNQLVLRAGLTWRQVVILRTYAKYLRQVGTVFTQDYLATTLAAFPELAQSLVTLFEARFSPHLRLTDNQPRDTVVDDIVATIESELDAVTSLDQDRILRGFLNLIMATTRTSFFQRGRDGRPKPYVAIKLKSQRLADLPEPKPKYEIFVYSPRFEGVHLRFGKVARGGLRWSDRLEDFRTEVLGLVKAQMVKNAVIVPVGAKGGFVLKRTVHGREALQAEGVACYKMFISALLDVTDNLDQGKVIPPPDVVRHDGDDPYLVVAADKGTATFSDTANEIAAGYGFWLGDAFASGGSVGYDHKKMGITARGGWESVKWHFRELGVNCQTEDFTAVGIGDMSGDVFGNGMLLSPRLKLVAAFDHRHIFIDPDPDPATSLVERQRLFDLPRSSWEDYDKSLISAGGGVWSRTAKSVPISEEARQALGLPDSAATLSPPELMKAILCAPVDLLWNGGIGTYVKASTETHPEVGDKSNDAVRVDGAKLRCRIVGEGGNLGLTQRGRIEYASNGGRINTDFIDNSAGVDCSDHEVNIKILLNEVVTRGELDLEARNVLLAEMTDEVATLVLRDNYDQNTTLGVGRSHAPTMMTVSRRMITELERTRGLNRELEALPSDKEMGERIEAGLGLTSPELAVVFSLMKIYLEDDVVASGLPDETWTASVLTSYFPTPIQERFPAKIAAHPLAREIVTTQVVNEAINRGGITFVYRVMEELGVDAADAIRAYVIAREVFGLPSLWAAVEELDNQVPTAAQTTVFLATRRLLDRAVRWLLQNRPTPLDVPAEIARLQPGVAQLLPDLQLLRRGSERDVLDAKISRLVELGIPDKVAVWSARTVYGIGLLDVVEVSVTSGRPLSEVAGVYYVLSDRFKVFDLLEQIAALPRDDHWTTLARMALRYDLYAAIAALTGEVLAVSSPSDDAEARVNAWAEVNDAAVTRVREAMAAFDGSSADLAALSVLLRQIRTAVRASSLAGGS